MSTAGGFPGGAASCLVPGAEIYGGGTPSWQTGRNSTGGWAKTCLPQLAASGAGAIVNIGGLTAHLGANRRAHVVAAKSGLVGLTRALAHELAAQNVTVNCVSPGRIATARRGPEPNAHRVPSLTGTSGAPDDIAATVRFLCGPRARYITGQTIHVNGGAYLSS